jgi:hypothetical protein
MELTEPFFEGESGGNGPPGGATAEEQAKNRIDVIWVPPRGQWVQMPLDGLAPEA